MTAHLTFERRREIALAILSKPDARLTRKAGSFLGQLVCDPAPMSEAQAQWLATLIEREGFTSTVEAHHG
jgi:hypothetical protein